MHLSSFVPKHIAIYVCIGSSLGLFLPSKSFLKKKTEHSSPFTSGTKFEIHNIVYSSRCTPKILDGMHALLNFKHFQAEDLRLPSLCSLDYYKNHTCLFKTQRTKHPNPKRNPGNILLLPI